MTPLAERLRPKTLDEYIGQKHLVGPGAILRKMIDAGRISSFILWGPPGVGKTTLAQIIANKLETPFYTLSAVTSGVKDVREVIERAKSNRFFSQGSPILDLVVSSEANDPVVITDEIVTERLQQNPLAYDKDGEMHYDIISAFIKSIRGSDPDGAVYWLARMVEAGEDPAFIARRLVISASEDIGLANPNAMLIANACFDAVMKVGWPEGRIPLAEATIYLATSPKSNSAYMAINNALELVRETGNLPVPLHLRNAPTKLMKQLGYGDNYKYSHDYPGHFVKQQFMPDELKKRRLWEAQDNAAEQKHAERMKALWGEDKFKK